MALIYAVVSRGDVVLVEYANAQGNFTTVTREILKRIDPFKNGRESYSYDGKLHFHWFIDSGLIFLCMADASYQKRRAHGFLMDIRESFLSQYGDTWQNAITLKFNNEFARVMKSKMDYHSDVNSDKLATIQNQIDQAKDVIVENIDKLVERQERIDILVTKTEELQDTSFAFKSQAKKMKGRFWWKNVRLIVIITVLVLVILFLIVWFGCGVPDFQNCKSKSPDPAPPPPN